MAVGGFTVAMDVSVITVTKCGMINSDLSPWNSLAQLLTHTAFQSSCDLCDSHPAHHVVFTLAHAVRQG